MQNKLNRLITLAGLIAGWSAISLWAPVSFFSVAVTAAFALLVPGYFGYRLIEGEDDAASGHSATVHESGMVRTRAGMASSHPLHRMAKSQSRDWAGSTQKQ